MNNKMNIPLTVNKDAYKNWLADQIELILAELDMYKQQGPGTEMHQAACGGALTAYTRCLKKLTDDC